MKTKVVIADDHAVVRSGLKMVLESSGQFEIIAEASDGVEAIELVSKHHPDLVILDISMPKLNGIETTRTLRARYPDLKILALTVHADQEYIYHMLHAGVSGYILKTAGRDEIFHAAASVLSGATYLSSGVSNIVVKGFIDRVAVDDNDDSHAPELNCKPTPSVSAEISPLTKREREILHLIALGLTNREIGEKIFISVRTVNTHRANLMQKLEIHDTAGLVRYAIAHGLLLAASTDSDTSSD